MSTDLPKTPFDPIPYTVWKELMDMRTWWKRTHAFGGPVQDPRRFIRNGEIVKVGNDTATGLLPGTVLQLENELTCDDSTAPKLHPPMFKGVRPTSPGARFAVLLQPCPAKYNDVRSVTVAQVSGVCIATINIVNDAHTRAGPTTDQHYLTSSMTGPVEILFKPTGTGQKQCHVRLSTRAGIKVFGFTGSAGIAAATLVSDEVTPSSASVDVWTLQSGKYAPLKDSSATQVTVTVSNPWPDAIIGDRLISFSEDDEGLVTVDAEACNAFEEEVS
jgi:hypothetical protein